MLPIASPAQVVQIAPEALEVANLYLENPSIDKVVEILGYSRDQVTEILDRREVKAYIDHIFLDAGFNNRFRLQQVMDLIISKKLEELDEAEVGSGKDIADLLALKHKMTIETLKAQIELEKIRSSKVQTQVNMQVNEFGGDGTKYGDLISKLLGKSTKP